MLRFAAVTCLLALPLAALADGDAPPASPRRPVVDDYFGARITDPFRWLERSDDAEVKAWIGAQDTHARAWLDRLPARKAIAHRLEELEQGGGPDYREMSFRGGYLFALKRDPEKQQPVLVVFRNPNDLRTEKVVLDPGALDAEGGTVIDFFEPSLDGKLVAVSLSRLGSEEGTLHVYESLTGKERGDVIPRVHAGTAGGSVAWNAASTGFHYTRYPRVGERPAPDLDFYQQVWFHALGDLPESDHYAFGKQLPRIAEIALTASDDGAWLLATVANGDGGEYAHYLWAPLQRGTDGPGAWSQVTRFEHKASLGRFGTDGSLYLLSRDGAPRGKLLRLPPGDVDVHHAVTIVEEGPSPIADFQITANRLFVRELHGGPSELRIYDRGGREHGLVPILPVSSVQGLVRLEADELLLRNESDLVPPGWFRYSGRTGKVAPTPLARKAAGDWRGYEVMRERATSKDGTQVPLRILRRKGTRLTGQNPTLLTGYGGFGISLEPGYHAEVLAFLEQGGVYAVAHLRGGGELGEEWHRAGMLTRKQNVFDDFAACMKYLVDTGYTRPSRLAVIGASNGGLLVGAVVTQHPEALRAAVAHAGLYDMLRSELSPNGAFIATEYGSVKDLEQWRALRLYSPYHRVVDGTKYPAVLLSVGGNDPRVDPMQSRKMAARLQSATGSDARGAPILLSVDGRSGHGGDSAESARVARRADELAFVMDRLGMSYRARK